MSEMAQAIVNKSRENCSNHPVTTARYLIEVVMNEEEPEGTPEQFKEALAKEFQRALDDGYFEDIRYDALSFNVTERTVLDKAPANDPE